MARLALTLCLVAAGCASSGPVQVAVPVAQRVEPPAELMAPLAAPSGVFVAPGTAGAVACILPAGKDALVDYVDALRLRDGAWQAWASP